MKGDVTAGEVIGEESYAPAAEGSGRSAADPTAVLSLTMLDGDTLGPAGEIAATTRILVGVRSPATNLTHPLVVSTPTQRVPKSVLDELLAEAAIRDAEQEVDLSFPERLLRVAALEGPVYDSALTTSHSPAIYAVQSLLARKLGVAAAMENGELHFTATPVALLVGSVLYDSPERLENADERDLARLEANAVRVAIRGERFLREYHAMCSVRVVVDDSSAIPAATSSYSELRWISVEQFVEMARLRDVSALFDDSRRIEYCVHGLCISSSYVYLNALGLPALTGA